MAFKFCIRFRRKGRAYWVNRTGYRPEYFRAGVYTSFRAAYADIRANSGLYMWRDFLALRIVRVAA